MTPIVRPAFAWLLAPTLMVACMDSRQTQDDTRTHTEHKLTTGLSQADSTSAPKALKINSRYGEIEAFNVKIEYLNEACLIAQVEKIAESFLANTLDRVKSLLSLDHEKLKSTLNAPHLVLSFNPVPSGLAANQKLLIGLDHTVGPIIPFETWNKTTDYAWLVATKDLGVDLKGCIKE